MDDHSLEPLLERLCQGDMAMARQLFTAYESCLRQFVRRRLPPRLRAKFDSLDVVQAVWADVLRSCQTSVWHFPDVQRFQAFLIQATRNRFIATVRKHRTALDRELPLGNLPSSEMPLCSQPAAPQLLEAEELWQQMLALCAPEHRELLHLKRQGVPMAELATRSGLHPGSIRRIFRNLARDLALDSGMAG